MQQRSPRTPKKPRNRRRELLIAAKALIRKGYAILPLEAADPKRPGSGKRPITAHGVKDATKDYLEFKRMVEDRAEFNIGIATGQINQLMVVDVDPRNGGDKTIRELITKHGKLPWSPKSRTGGGGTHRYFKVPKGMVSNGGKLGTGIDIKLDNGYVVAPPSGHASGKRYEWFDDRSLFDGKVPELPAAWLEVLNANIAQKENQGERLLEAKAAQVPDGSSAMAGAAIPEGQRNTTLTSIAGRLRAAGRSVADVETELKRINRERCQPSLDDGEVSKIAMSSERWAPAAGVGDPGLAERVQEILLERHYAGGKHLRFERDGTFYHFAATHWGKIDATSVQKQVLAIIRNQFPGDRRRLMPVANEVMALLRVEAAGNDDALHFVTDPPQVINVLNGELWLLPDGQVDLRPHRPETGMRHVLPVTYDPDATSPQYDKAVAEIFSKAKFPNRMTKVWHQLMGYSIQPNRPRPTIVVLIGPGGDGKTKLVQTVARLVGSDAVYSGDVARLETSPFGIGGLVGKLLFIDDDVKAGARLPDGILKKVSEGKELTGERKHKDPFNFVCRALPILLCNNIPSMADLSPGIQRRLMVFKCNRQFTEKEQDKTLFNRIWAGEMPGVLNRALQGWSEFVNNKFEFDGSLDLRKGKTDLLVQANPLAAYIDERWEKEPSASVSITDLYVDFTRWSQDSGYNFPVVKNKLRRQVADLGYTVKLVNGYPYALGLKPKKQAGSNG